ncbi:MAG: type II secretion system minor pseudopilin GspK [Legionellales bacterium]|nr:type II secretion system minor pseudopilin GspK [Legionellales bacterium]
MHRPTHKGSALLTALFIITLISIVATAVSVRIRNDIQTIHLIESSDQFYLASQAIGIWAIDRITDPKQQLGKVSKKDGAILNFPSKLQHMYPNITLSGQLFDLQSRFNLNMLTNAQNQPFFYGLLGALQIGETSQERKELMDSVIYWIQPPKMMTTHDEWHDKYARQKPVFFPSQMPMYHSSELRLVYGVSAKYYQALAPMVTALPEATAINLNTVPATLLRLMGNNISDNDIKHILQVRSSKPFKDPQEIAPIIEKYHIPNGLLTVESHYFLAVATIKSTDISMQVFMTLKRQKDKTGLWHASILTQSINSP